MGLMKIFSGTEVLAVSLQNKIEAVGITTVIKNNKQANVESNYKSDRVVELFIQETDFSKVNPVIEEFRMSI
jgi:hypothetical protein